MSTQRARRLRPVVSATRPRAVPVLLATGTGMAVLLAGLVVWSSGTGPDDQQAPAAMPETSTIAAEGDATAEEEVDGALVPVPLPLVAYELVLARDPFEPVVPEPEPVETTDPDEPAGDGGTADGGTGNGGTGDSGTGDGSTSTDGGDGTASSSCTTSVEVVCDGRVLTVVEVLEENGEMIAVIQVDTMRWRVGVGDVFADRFQVLSISPDEVRVLYGDRIVTILVRDNVLK